MQILDTKSIAQLSDEKYTLCNEDDTAHVIESLGITDAEGYHGAFVEVVNGDYGEVWLFVGIVPYLSKLAARVH